MSHLGNDNLLELIKERLAEELGRQATEDEIIKEFEKRQG
tara:strand:- start:8682 stop:8801 length:120 start_codon:yes stop_codon:yes gene_type:complete